MGDTAITAIATIAGAIIGAIIAGPVSYFYSKRLVEQSNKHNLEAVKIADFNKAAAEFRAAFVDLIHILRNANNMKTGDECFFTMRQFRTVEVNNAHEKAKIRFEPFIEKADAPGFDAAWNTYYNWQSHIDNKDNNIVPDFLGHLYALLDYAKPK